MSELLDLGSLPAGFSYPRQLVRAVELGITNLEPWWIHSGAELRERSAALRARYPRLELVPFAWKQDCDDIACIDVSGQIFTVHDYTEPAWTIRGPSHSDFNMWLKQAIQDYIDFD